MAATQHSSVFLPAYDADNNRISTYILVSGYIREFNNVHKDITIPPEIVHLCFEFWIIDACDAWDKSVSNPKATIDGQSATFNIDGHYRCCIFGTQIIESGLYEWRIKFKTDMNRLSVGLIKNRDALLKRNQTSFAYGMNGDGCFLYYTGKFFYSKHSIDDISGYCNKFGKKDTIIIMTLDMDKQSVRYKINDTDYGYIDAKCVKKEQQYRLAVTLDTAGKISEIVLL